MDLNQVHIDAVLTNIAIEFAQPGYCANRIFPFVNVKKESDKYFKFVSREELRSEKDKGLRAPGAEAHEIEWEGTTDSYSADEHAFCHFLPDRIRDNSDVPIRPRARVTRKITAKLWLGFEERVQALTQDVGLPGANVSNKWNVANGTPETDVDAAVEEIRKSLGSKPSHLLLASPVARAVKNKLKAAAFTSLAEEISFTDLPPVLWNLQTVVAESIHNTAHLGQAVLSIADVWDDTACVLKIDSDPGLETFGFGVTFMVQNFLMKSWRIEARKGEMQEGSLVLAEKRLMSEAIYRLVDTL